MSSILQNQTKQSVTTPAITGRKVLFQLENPLLPESTLKETPSRADGFDIETETDLRILGCEMIQTAGMLLKLPQVAMAAGQMYFQRFYYSNSFVRYPMEIMAMGSIYLASKVEEKPRRIRDVINVFHHMKQVRAQTIITPLIVDQKIRTLTNEVIRAEMFILKTLGFCVHVKHPHKLMLVYLQFLQCENNRHLMQMAFNYLNDASLTNVFMRFPPETIACACIYLSARKIGLPLPNNPHWFLLFKVTEENIREVCIRILQLYKRAKVNPKELESKVDGLRKIYKANKQKQAQKDQDNAKTEDKKEHSPTVSTPKELNRRDKTGESPKTPPLPSKYHSSHKSKKERTSRCPYDCTVSTVSSVSTSKELNRRDKTEESPKTPPLPSKYHSSHKSKKERRSRCPYDRKREYSSKRHKPRSRDRELDRSRERRHGDKRGRDMSRKYDDYDRSKSSRDSRENRDEKRNIRLR